MVLSRKEVGKTRSRVRDEMKRYETKTLIFFLFITITLIACSRTSAECKYMVTGNVYDYVPISIPPSLLFSDVLPFIGPASFAYAILCRGEGLVGTIPDMSAYTALRTLWISDNALTGSVPEMSANTGLRYFDLSVNELSGTIHDMAANTELRELRLHSNDLIGSIPDMSASPNLGYLELQNNALTSSIPDMTVNVNGNLGHLDLSNNKLTGVEPDYGIFSENYSNNCFGGEGSDVGTDIILALDVTHKRRDMKKLKRLLERVIGQLTISASDVRVGVITYSDSIRVEVGLDDPASSDKNLLLQVISAIKPRPRLTNMAGALTKILESTDFLQSTSRLSGARVGAPAVVLLVQDGIPNRPTRKNAVYKAKQAATNIKNNDPSLNSIFSLGFGRGREMKYLKSFSDKVILYPYLHTKKYETYEHRYYRNFKRSLDEHLAASSGSCGD